MALQDVLLQQREEEFHGRVVACRTDPARPGPDHRSDHVVTVDA